ncbi:MAG: esterase [Oligoflexia bacterium]|nr:MAG: esterase [Oligoflexia bacterium]
MKSSIFEQKLIKRIEEKLPGAAPGIMVQVHQAGKKVCDIAVGETYAYYDLASLTKIIFTTQAMIGAFQDGKWNLSSKVKDYLKWFPSEETLILDLLNHSSGLPWWLPIYKEMNVQQSVEDRWKYLQQVLEKVTIEKRDSSVYSDVGFFVLSFLLQEMYQMPIKSVWLQTKEMYYPRLSIDFSENNIPKQPVKYYAPTEKCPWRGRILHGEVHDENCWALGGISTHAGLFGSIDDIGWFGLYVRGQLHGISKTVIKQKTAQLFATRSRPLGKGDFAIGYMMPTPGASSSGDYFSPYSIGHTGFTGTSYWYDPAQDLSVAILSNRVAFGREREDFKLLRPQIHNWIVEGLRRS